MMINAGFGKKIVVSTLLLTFFCVVPGTWADGCYTVVVGKDASADGYVIMGHNEDDGPPQIVNHHKVPSVKHTADEKVQLLSGGEVGQPPETWSYIRSEMPGMKFSDSYLNEWGVCVASDACRSREGNPELTDGGITYWLRRLVAERAKSAREGVLLAGKLVERFGYDASGRTLTICDPDEGWLFCAVNGKHWLAQRVPDDHVAVIANTYTVHGVDLPDTTNFLASDDIIDYAVARGWYDPEAGRPFDFAAAYANPEVAADSGNFCRQWGGLRHVAAETIPLGQHLPFSVKPKSKMDVAAVKKILRDHYEGTELYTVSDSTGCPHEGAGRSICMWATQTSFVAQLRRDISPDIGLIYWATLAPPCGSVYIPFHFGITEFPTGYVTGNEQPSEEVFGAKTSASFAAIPEKAFWTHVNFQYQLESVYGEKTSELTDKINKIETRALSRQALIEKKAREMSKDNMPAARSLLGNYSRGIYLEALEMMAEILPEK